MSPGFPPEAGNTSNEVWIVLQMNHIDHPQDRLFLYLSMLQVFTVIGTGDATA
jgi:hypothetical protein